MTTPRPSGLDGAASCAGSLSTAWSVYSDVVAGDTEALFPVFEEVKKEVFAGRLPASTCVCVKRLLDERYRVEVKLVAAVPET